jgi:hypothetical protein
MADEAVCGLSDADGGLRGRKRSTCSALRFLVTAGPDKVHSDRYAAVSGHDESSKGLITDDEEEGSVGGTSIRNDGLDEGPVT